MLWPTSCWRADVTKSATLSGGQAGTPQDVGQRGYAAHHFGIAVLVRHVIADDDVPGDVHVVLAKAVMDNFLESVGEGSVSYVMQHRGGPDLHLVEGVDLQRGAQLRCDVIRAQGMLQTGVVGTRENEVCQA